MTRSRPEELEFAAADDAELLGHMGTLSGLGTGWINIEPVIDEEYEPAPPGPFAFLGGSTHTVTTATWRPGRIQADGSAKPTTIGLQHAAGTHVARRLRELGLPLPAGWRITQDHPRRGLVVSVPPDADHGEVLRWLLEASTATCAVPTTGRWRAAVHAGLA